MLQPCILFVHSYLSFLWATHSRVHQVNHGDWQELIHPNIQNAQFLVAVGGTGWPFFTFKYSGGITVQGGHRNPRKILCVNTDQNFNFAAHYSWSFYFTKWKFHQRKPARLPAVLKLRAGFTDMGVACCPHSQRAQWQQQGPCVLWRRIYYPMAYLQSWSVWVPSP